jgi:uncharacterized membrane protein
MKPNVSHKRHIFKTITWRIVGTGLTIGGLELCTKMILYYLHERVWYKSSFGVKK